MRWNLTLLVFDYSLRVIGLSLYYIGSFCLNSRFTLKPFILAAVYNDVSVKQYILPPKNISSPEYEDASKRAGIQ